MDRPTGLAHSPQIQEAWAMDFHEPLSDLLLAVVRICNPLIVLLRQRLGWRCYPFAICFRPLLAV